jgi:hypothetical protein
MASTNDLVVRIKADTSEFDKAMDHIQFRLWWYRHSSKVLAALSASLTLLGGSIGFLLGLQF